MSGRVRTITVRETSRLLDVSEATVRNWVRHGYLKPADSRPQGFYYNDVLDVKKKLASGKIDRLNQRANRTRLARSIIPGQYVNDPALTRQAKNICEIFDTKRLGLEKAMFCLTVRLLVLKKEVVLEDPGRMFHARSFSGWQRQSLKKEVLDWLASPGLTSARSGGKYLDLYQALEATTGDDILGLLYQSLRREGNRSRQGMYYTPSELLDGVIENKGTNCGCFLDPCCGTGQFLTYAARSGCFHPQDLVGFDNDTIAVRIARTNLLLLFAEKEFSPRVFCLDVLNPDKVRPYREGFQLIATNPPWGAVLASTRRGRLHETYPVIASRETFSYFLAAGMDLLADGGQLSFILPESFLNIRAHQDIRKHLLSSTTLLRVVFLGRRFGGVLSSAIRVDLKKRVPTPKAKTCVVLEDARTHKVSQERFLKNDDYIIDAGLSQAEAAVINKIYAFPHVTLAETADWALGIVTGDNRKYLSDVCLEGMEPVFRGKDIEPFRLRKPGAFIRFKPEQFQQTAPENKYRAREKLVYRFVSRRLVFALDKTGGLTLNSANIVIPRIDGYPLRAVLGVMNSTVCQFVFAKKFRALKVLRQDLESLPLPLLNQKRLKELVGLVDRAIGGENTDAAIDDLIMDGLGLSEEEKRIVIAGAGSF